MFVPHSEIDLKKMFEELSISSLDDLFTHIPETLKLNDGLNVPPSLSELESISDFENLESKNTQNLICFAGGGHYDVYLPQTVKSLTMRPEFMTSYTPSALIMIPVWGDLGPVRFDVFCTQIC